MRNLELNIKKIEKHLKALGKNRAWLSREAGVTRQAVTYWMQTKSIKGADKIAPVLNLDPKDLIK